MSQRVFYNAGYFFLSMSFFKQFFKQFVTCIFMTAGGGNFGGGSNFGGGNLGGSNSFASLLGQQQNHTINNQQQQMMNMQQQPLLRTPCKHCYKTTVACNHNSLGI